MDENLWAMAEDFCGRWMRTAGCNEGEDSDGQAARLADGGLLEKKWVAESELCGYSGCRNVER
jgi:hypothetical protein